MKIVENNNVNVTEKVSNKKRKSLKKLNQSTEGSEPVEDVELSPKKNGKKRELISQTENDNSMVENSPKKKKMQEIQTRKWR